MAKSVSKAPPRTRKKQSVETNLANKSKDQNTVKLPDGRILGFAQYGHPDGKPLFFFHGWPGCRLQAEILHQTAGKLNIRIISPDRPGFGLSAFKENRKLIEWPDDVCSLADFLKIKKFAVLGQSGGGPYAAACAYKIPGRLTKVGICVGLAPTDINGVLKGMEFTNRLTWKAYHYFPYLMNLSTTLFFLQAKKLLPVSMKFSYKSRADRILLTNPKLLDNMKRIRKEAFRQGKKGALQDLRCYINDWNFNLKYIKTKVFLWYGDDDKNVSAEMGKYYNSRIPGSVLKIYPHEGHLILNTHTEEILGNLVK